MPDELIDILNQDHSILKTALKSEAHKKGWLHASVHVWFYTKSGEILFQKRSKDKIAFPSLWDVSVAGHIEAGESNITSAIREIKEEIGLDVKEKDLIEIGSFTEKHQHRVDFIDYELHHIYICQLKHEISKLTIQEEELSALKLVNIKDFEKTRSGNDFINNYVSHDQKYYSFIIKHISEKLQP